MFAVSVFIITRFFPLCIDMSTVLFIVFGLYYLCKKPSSLLFHDSFSL